MKYVIALFLSLSLVPTSSAAWFESTIKTVYPLADGRFVLIPSEDAKCAADNYMYVVNGRNGVNAEGAKNILSVSLAAASMGKKVNINYEKIGEICYVNRLSVIF